MSSFLIYAGERNEKTDRAFHEGIQQLSSRCSGAVRSGTRGRVRWAAIADPSEIVETHEALSIVDAVPFMIQPRREPATADGLTGVKAEWANGRAEITRDVFGSKPLHYASIGDGWAISSEGKALLPFLDSVAVDPIALSDAVNYRWILGEHTLVSGLRQLIAGETRTLVPGKQSERKTVETPRFAPESPGSYAAACDATDAALRVSLRRIANAGSEISVLISGGIDSSVLAAIAKSEGLPLRGYIVRYEGHENPEYDRACQVAKWLKIEVEEVVVPLTDMRDRLARMVWRLEQPPRNANNAAIERLFEAIQARRGVVLHGDGAEMMFGLADVFRLQNFSRKYRVLRTILGAGPWPRTVRTLSRMKNAMAEKILRVAQTTPADFARQFDAIRYSDTAREVFDRIASDHNPCAELSALLPDHHLPTAEDLQLFQTCSFLQCSLVRLDRIAAPLGVPVAIPFLSDEVTEVALRLPVEFKGRGGKGKPILRDLCDKYLPNEVARWPKMGFQSPDRAWAFDTHTPWMERSGNRGVLSVLSKSQVDRLMSVKDYEGRWFLATLDLALTQFDQVVLPAN